MALNDYELASGDSFAYGYHMHETQEEIFIIQEGEVTFETEDADVVVDAGDVIRFAPGEYQPGIATDDEQVVALATDAPQETGDAGILRECATCDERTPQTVERVDDGQAKSAAV
ncbi:cupin domain-containing protein [Halorubrum trueperi]|uniref:Cupin domain-containing protein n=1 Tax=Halorubrum trueperi TaxID=2004704 RepID=A0ABD5UQF2_9EURY